MGMLHRNLLNSAYVMLVAGQTRTKVRSCPSLLDDHSVRWRKINQIKTLGVCQQRAHSLWQFRQAIQACQSIAWGNVELEAQKPADRLAPSPTSYGRFQPPSSGRVRAALPHFKNQRTTATRRRDFPTS